MLNIPTVIELCQLSFPKITNKIALMHGDMLLGDNLSPEVNYTDWAMGASTSVTTFSLNLHKLSMVFSLAYAYHVSGNTKYLTKATDIVQSWVQYQQEATDPNPYTWHGQTATSRVPVLIFLDLLQQKNGIETPWLTELIREHGNFLMAGENYYPKENKGILSDISLTAAGVYVNQVEFLQLGIARLVRQLDHAFPNQTTYEGNAFMSNFDVVWSLSTIFVILKKIGLIEPLWGHMNGMLSFLMHSTTPLAEIPPIGHSYGGFFRASQLDVRTCAAMGHRGLLYVMSKGTHGTMPPDIGGKTYLADGYSFFRASGELDGLNMAFNMDTWLCFKAGFTHVGNKHQDDLSLVLTAKGANIFIDPGMCQGKAGNIYTEYLQSAFAHNGIIVDNAPYPLNSTHKAGILSEEDIEGIRCVRAYNNLYPDVYIDRTILWVDAYEFHIIDDIHAKSFHEYSQNFHLAGGVSLSTHTPRFSVIHLPNRPWNLCILQHSPVENATVKTGDTGDMRTMSIQSTSHADIQDSTSIQYTKTGKNTRFVTTIKVVPEADVDQVLYSPSPLKGDFLAVNGIDIPITPRKRVVPVKLEVDTARGLVDVRHHSTGEFAYTLLHAHTGAVVCTAEYDAAPVHTILIPKEGEYVLLAHRRIGNEAVQWCAGEVEAIRPKRTTSFTPIPLYSAIPYVKRRVAHNSGSNHSTFELVLAHHHYPYDILWEVYKNGELYHQVEGGRMLTQKFLEPGTYTCYYTVSTKAFGVIEKGNFLDVEKP